MWGIPSSTPYDVRFRLLGIPVRIHPFFWLMALLLGGVGQSEVRLAEVLIWVGCVTASILVHEFGHGLTARRFGYPASVVLYGMGGLCSSGGERQSPRERLAVIAMGPGAGLLLCAVALLAGQLLFRLTAGDILVVLGSHLGLRAGHATTGLANLVFGLAAAQPAALIFWDLVYINFFWSLLNLLPIWPLDGGQIAGELLRQASPHHGRRWTHVLGMMTAGVLALLCYLKFRRTFLAVFFALFALTNYQLLSALHQKARYGVSDEGR